MEMQGVIMHLHISLPSSQCTGDRLDTLELHRGHTGALTACLSGTPS